MARQLLRLEYEGAKRRGAADSLEGSLEGKATLRAARRVKYQGLTLMLTLMLISSIAVKRLI
jgi:hypothetical protein